MANKKGVLVFIIAQFICFCAADYGGVPALIWTNTDVEFQNPLAGHTTRSEEFQKDYLGQVAHKSGHSLVAFVQDKLSLEDIIDNADVYNEHSTGDKFANLKNLVETYTSVHLPSVAAPGDAIDRLTGEFKGQIHHLKAPFSLNDVNLDPAASHLVVIHLPSNDGKSFEKIDRIIGTVSSDLKKLGISFTALYTGRSASKVQAEESQYLGRHLLAETDSKNASFYNVTNCIYLYFERMYFDLTKVEKGSKTTTYSVELPNGNSAASGSVCNNETETKTLKLDLKPSDPSLKSFILSMTFGYSPTGYWKSNMTVKFVFDNSSISTGPIDRTVKLDASDIFAPRAFSYHCSDMSSIVEHNYNKSDVKIIAGLRFKQLQVQFDEMIENDQFGYPNDCMGFFSITIFSGLVAAVVLASILAFGICMIVNISTMDRFDDPKGKTISIGSTEG